MVVSVVVSFQPCYYDRWVKISLVPHTESLTRSQLHPSHKTMEFQTPLEQIVDKVMGGAGKGVVSQGWGNSCSHHCCATISYKRISLPWQTLSDCINRLDDALLSQTKLSSLRLVVLWNIIVAKFCVFQFLTYRENTVIVNKFILRFQQKYEGCPEYQNLVLHTF